MQDRTEPRKIGRRTVLAGAAFVPVTALRLTAQQTVDSVFSTPQKRCLEAFVNRLVPSDEYGPGAVECGVVEYIERSLAGPLAGGKPAILAAIDAVDATAREMLGAPLAELTPDKQDAVLSAIEKNAARGFEPNSAAFFALVRRLTLEGMFSDPSYGGNRNFAGWDLIRYPGPRMAVAPDDQRMGVPVKPVRYSVNGGGHAH
jgi:gluconate 2-dehydrogenase gamma chain